MSAHKNKSALSGAITFNKEGSEVKGKMSYAFSKAFSMAEPAPLWALVEGRSSQTAALLGGAVEDCVDTVSAKPLGLCDCFYLFNTKK